MDVAGMKYALLIWKRRIEDLFILPFVAWGRWRASREPFGGEYDIWFFFPFWHTGGAEKVHAQLANAFPDRKAIIVFTRRSQDERFRTDFESSGHTVIDISAHTDHKSAYWNNLVWRGRISHWMGRQKNRPVLVNGQCNFAYKLSRWCREDIPQVELIHSLNSFSYIRIPFLPFYRTTVMISRNRIADHLDLYERYGIPSAFGERILYIGNGIPLPAGPLQRNTIPGTLKILYAGRGTAEKRVHLVDAIARASREAGSPVTAAYMGDVDAGLRHGRNPLDHFYGNLSDPFDIDSAYLSADILVITSSEEGFPMVVMEAMARGCAILATPVGDLPLHVKPGVNGWLFSTVLDENKIVREGVSFLEEALKDPSMLESLGRNNREYAMAHFSIVQFEQRWRNLLDPLNSTKQV
jgi:glycosyltransferase involved in cell wall biosynthesis